MFFFHELTYQELALEVAFLCEILEMYVSHGMNFPDLDVIIVVILRIIL